MRGEGRQRPHGSKNTFLKTIVASTFCESSCLMFLKVCRSSSADEDAHRGNNKRTMSSLRNSFLVQTRKDPKAVNGGPPLPNMSSSLAKVINNPSKRCPGLSGRIGARREFLKVTTQGLGTQEFYSNSQNLPSLEVAYKSFKHTYPRFSETAAVDRLREREYGHLAEREHACFDYCGFGLFSHWQQVFQRESSSFNLAYISATLPTHALYGTAQGTVESHIKKRIMNYMNLSDSDYCMVFTASRVTAYKLLAESYPFHVNNRLLTVYDYESDAVSSMIETAKKNGAKTLNASFKWPNFKIASSDLKYKLMGKKKKKDQSAKGLFVFPVQSRVTGAKYSYQWMSHAQANKWHVLLDASALGPKDMDSLALSLFRPEFVVTSFYKVFGADPTGFGCLFIHNSIIQSLHNSDGARSDGMVRIIPSVMPNTQLAGGEELQEDLERLPDIHEMTAEEYLDAANYVDPVSAFSGPMSQFHVDSVREKAILERITSSGREMNIAGFDDDSGRTSLPSENEEEWDDELHRDRYLETESSRNDEDFGHQDDFSRRVSRSCEVDEEPSEPIFPLTRRWHKSEGHAPSPTEGCDAYFSEETEELSRIVSKISNLETMKDDDRVLRILDDALPSKEDSSRFLSRIREEESDECVSPSYPEATLEALDNQTGGSASHTTGSLLFHSPPESTVEFSDRFNQGAQKSDYKSETNIHEKKVGAMTETDKLETSITFRDSHDYALREGREVNGFYGEERMRAADLENSNGSGHFLGSSGANGRRLQSWSPGEGSLWEAQYAMSEEGSTIYLDDDLRIMESSNDDMFDEGPIVCSGLDHADSQGLNRSNLRLRFLTNWLINALLRLRHPTQETNLVHIYGPKVHFDRGQALAFNLFDLNGVPIKAELVQRLADRNNISLGLGTLGNIVYPEGTTDQSGSWLQKHAEGGVNEAEGKVDPPPPHSSNTLRHDHQLEISVVTAAVGFVSTFEDVYRLWAFAAKFLEASSVKREERDHYSLNQGI